MYRSYCFTFARIPYFCAFCFAHFAHLFARYISRVYGFAFSEYLALFLLFTLTVTQPRRLGDVCCLFYKHDTSALYDRPTYLCCMKLTFKMASYQVRNGRMAARITTRTRTYVRQENIPVCRGTSFTCAHLVYRSH